MMAKQSKTMAANANKMTDHGNIEILLDVGGGALQLRALLANGRALDTVNKVHFRRGLGFGIIGLGTYLVMPTFYQDDHYSAAALFRGSGSAIFLGARVSARI
jgi:hypothetical protein